MSSSVNHLIAQKFKYVCSKCDFTFFIGLKKLPRGGKAFCPSCGENIYTEKCDIHRRHWTLNEWKLIDEILAGSKTKYQVAEMTKRSYGSVQRKCEIRRNELKSRHDVLMQAANEYQDTDSVFYDVSSLYPTVMEERK